MVEIPYGGLSGNSASADHLWDHGISMLDAEDVWFGPAKYFPQDASEQETNGWIDQRPDRVMMVGPSASGRLLTIILELPDVNGFSHVVTGWVSTRDQQSRYHQPGGRMRRR